MDSRVTCKGTLRRSNSLSMKRARGCVHWPLSGRWNARPHYVHAGRYFEARNALQDALGRYPGDPRALYALVVACGDIGDGPCANSNNLEFEEIWHGPPLSINDL